jgi:hypothetical protein
MFNMLLMLDKEDHLWRRLAKAQNYGGSNLTGHAHPLSRLIVVPPQ